MNEKLLEKEEYVDLSETRIEKDCVVKVVPIKAKVKRCARHIRPVVEIPLEVGFIKVGMECEVYVGTKQGKPYIRLANFQESIEI